MFPQMVIVIPLLIIKKTLYPKLLFSSPFKDGSKMLSIGKRGSMFLYQLFPMSTLNFNAD